MGPGAVRPAMASVASAFCGHPARSLQTVGVTGTNGKTTVTQLVGRSWGRRASHRGHRHPGRDADHPRVARPPAVTGRGPGRRPAGGGHGGVLPRPDPAPGGRHRLRRGRLHQPEPGPPRPPRSMDAYFEAKATLFDPRTVPAGRRLRRRPLGGPPGSTGWTRPPSDGPSRRGDGCRPGGGRVDSAGGDGRCDLPLTGRVQRGQRPGGRGQWPSRSGWTRSGGGRVWLAAPVVPGRMEVVAPVALLGGGRLRPHPGRARRWR